MCCSTVCQRSTTQVSDRRNRQRPLPAYQKKQTKQPCRAADRHRRRFDRCPRSSTVPKISQSRHAELTCRAAMLNRTDTHPAKQVNGPHHRSRRETHRQTQSRFWVSTLPRGGARKRQGEVPDKPCPAACPTSRVQPESERHAGGRAWAGLGQRGAALAGAGAAAASCERRAAGHVSSHTGRPATTCICQVHQVSQRTQTCHRPLHPHCLPTQLGRHARRLCVATWFSTHQESTSATLPGHMVHKCRKWQSPRRRVLMRGQAGLKRNSHTEGGCSDKIAQARYREGGAHVTRGGLLPLNV